MRQMRKSAKGGTVLELGPGPEGPHRWVGFGQAAESEPRALLEPRLVPETTRLPAPRERWIRGLNRGRPNGGCFGVRKKMMDFPLALD